MTAANDNLVKVQAPEGVTNATVQGTQYAVKEDGFFYMLEKHLHDVLTAGFHAVVEKGKELVHGIEAEIKKIETIVEGGPAAETITAAAPPATDTLAENEGGKPAPEAQTAPEGTQGGDGAAPAAETITAA